MEVVQKKKYENFNDWMIDKNFIAKSSYPNKEYLFNLTKELYNYLKTMPFHAVSSLDNKFHNIFFLLGAKKWAMKIVENQPIKDFLNALFNKFDNSGEFPSYKVEVEVEQPLSQEAILQQLKVGVSLNDALSQKEIVKEQEEGKIIEIARENFTFILSINGLKQKRVTGTIEKQMGVFQFLDALRAIDNQEEKRNFIMKNSTFYSYL